MDLIDNQAMSAEMGDTNKAEDINVDDNDNKLFLCYLCITEDVSCQETLVQDETKPIVCDRKKRFPWIRFSIQK